MRRMLALAMLALPLGLAASAAEPRSVPGDFSLILDYTATGWAAECEVGCTWKAAFSCESACNALVDSRGLVTLGEIRPPDPKFAFVIEHTRIGVRARARSGAAWITVSWGCRQEPCRARITEAGVTVLGTVR